MEGQKKGECGHIMASLDSHANCVHCRECNLASAPCAVCLAMTPEQQEAALLAHGRRQRRIQRRKERAARDRASSVGSSSSKHSSGSVAVGDSLAVDRPTPGSPVAPAKGGGSTAADSAVTNSATPVPSLRRDGGQGPSVTPSTWVDDRGSASLRGQIDGEPATRALGLMAAALTPRRGGSSHAVGCDIPGLGRRSNDVTGHPRRIGRRPSRSLSSRTLGWTKTAWTRIGVAGWSPTENGSIAGCGPRLVAWPPALSGLLRGSRD